MALPIKKCQNSSVSGIMIISFSCGLYPSRKSYWPPFCLAYTLADDHARLWATTGHPVWSNMYRSPDGKMLGSASVQFTCGAPARPPSGASGG